MSLYPIKAPVCSHNCYWYIHDVNRYSRLLGHRASISHSQQLSSIISIVNISSDSTLQVLCYPRAFLTQQFNCNSFESCKHMVYRPSFYFLPQNRYYGKQKNNYLMIKLINFHNNIQSNFYTRSSNACLWIIQVYWKCDFIVSDARRILICNWMLIVNRIKASKTGKEI